MILEYQLQYFAQDGPGGEKTEPATAKKLSDARKEGQVAKSREIANAMSLLAVFLILRILGGMIGNGLGDNFQHIYNQIPDLIKTDGGDAPLQNLSHVLVFGLLRVIVISAPVLIIGFIVAFLSDYIQVGWAPTGKPLTPSLTKLNPMNGFKRLFSVNSLMELVKSIAKVILIAYVTYSYIKGKNDFFFILLDMPLTQAVGLITSTVVDLGLRVSLVYMVIAATDFAYQKIKFANDMKMTKQEIKDEMKDTEGSPDVKSKQRQRMQEASRRRMMQSLPQADVVITNPTHFAVAIKYDAEKYSAPVVLAKGADYLAQKIKEVARENQIEIVENKPLARMLYANVDIGEQVPPELYQAVAEVLAYVYHLKGKT